MRNCGKKPDGDGRVDTVFVGDTITKMWTDTIIRYRTIEIPDTLLVEKVIRDTVWIKQVVGDYFSKFKYFDTIQENDVVVRIEDLVTENKIKSRSYSVQNLRQSQIITKRDPQRNKVFVGGGVTMSGDDIGYEINGYLLNKKDHLFGVSYDPPNKTVGFNAAFKIRLRRK